MDQGGNYWTLFPPESGNFCTLFLQCSSYGLYFDVAETGVSAPPMPLIFSSSNITLKSDPGNLDGAALATSSGVGFANSGATGAADDITLGTGAVARERRASIRRRACAPRTSSIVASAPAGEAGFFLAPDTFVGSFLDFLATTNPGLLQVNLRAGRNNDTNDQWLHGITQFVPSRVAVVLFG